MKFILSSAVFVALQGCMLMDNAMAGVVSYTNCNVTDYYESYGLGADFTSWKREEVFQALKSSHRNIVINTNRTRTGSGDVWEALIELDQGKLPFNEKPSISLLYTDSEMASRPFGSQFWVKERIFPITRGIGTEGPDFTDLHNLRATTSLTDVVRDDKYFGKCRVLVRQETCISPAEGASADTCACNRVFEPPMASKGDIARALMYMDIRYDGSDPNTVDLRLTDCPFDRVRDMGYLSQMLAWHEEDPPSEEEKVRNQGVCEEWQGNRNPFIDFQDLARLLYDDPKPLPAAGERLIYEGCESVPTSPPTFTPNECEMLNPGDFAIFIFNSQDPDNVAAYNFEELEEGFDIFMTDNAWDGNGFQETDSDSDGTLIFTVPSGGLPRGTLFGYGDTLPMNEVWKVHQGTFSLSEQGEQIHIYCEKADGQPRPLYSVTYSGSWVDPATKSPPLTSGESYLPVGLERSSVVLEKKANYQYVGPSNDTTAEELKRNVTDPSNWIGSDSSRFVAGNASGSRALSSFSTILAGSAIWMVFFLCY